MMIELRQRWWLLVLAGYGLLCALMAWHLHAYPSQVPNGDAAGYLILALDARAKGLLGLLGRLDPTRTYGYVWFLYFCSLLFGTGRQALIWGVVCVQAIFYAVATLSLIQVVTPRSRVLAKAIAIGLLLNPILVALIMDTLTEGVTLIAAISLLTILIRAATASTFTARLPWLIGGAALAGFALMIRPANVCLMLAWHVSVLPILVMEPWRVMRKHLLVYGGSAAAVSVFVWAPQLFISAWHFGRASIYPVGLGDFQVTMGLKLLKYATQVKPGLGAAGLPYPNPWLTNIPETQPWQWYLDNPGAGLLTATSHVFNALNYDHPFVYVYDTSLPYAIPLAFICWIVYALAVADGIAWLSRWRNLMIKNLDFAVVLFLTVSTAISLATIAVSAVESRFSTLILATAGVLACHFIDRLGEWSPARRYGIVAAVTTSGFVGVVISEWMKTLLKLS